MPQATDCCHKIQRLRHIVTFTLSTERAYNCTLQYMPTYSTVQL